MISDHARPHRASARLAAAMILMSFVGFAPASSPAATMFYTDQTTFDAAEPGLPVESFSSLIGPSQPYTLANHLGLPGLTISTVAPGLQSNALIFFGSSIGNNWFGDTLVLAFASGVNAVGADIFSQIGEAGSTPVSAPITETIYSGTTALGENTVTEAAGFFGVSSTSPITSVSFFSDCNVDCSTFVNNIAFGPAAAAVPEPDSFVIMLAGLALLGLAVRARRA